MENCLPTVPEVPLKWQEFVWSLEKLRHKPYSKKVREKDWFRINPLEMVLLGCQTLQTCTKASRDHGTMMLSMEDISEYMIHRPRYWTRIVSVLVATICGKDTPGLIIQRCSTALVQLWTGVKKYNELRSNFVARCIVKEKMIDIIDLLLGQHKKHLSPVTHQDLCDISIEIQSYQSDVNIFTTQLTANTPSLATPPVTPIVLLDAIVRSKHNYLSSKESIIYLVRTVMTRIDVFTNDECDLPVDKMNEVIAQFDDEPSFDNNITTLFSILLLLIIRGRKEKKVTTSISMDDGDEVKTHDHLLETLFQQITSFISQWSKLIQTDPQVLTRLLEMIHTCLASFPLDLSLPSIVQFLTDYMQTVMSYSTEGYLSDNPTDFFLQLVEFISSLAEQGIEPTAAIQQNLPNLFGPFFGVRRHNVSCQLLEYGYLSVCSQHKKALLTEGIDKIVSLWHLFPSIDRKMADERALYIHKTSLEICEDILTELVTSLPLPGTPIPVDSNKGQQFFEEEDAVKKEIFEVSEEERQRDKDGRILVLLRLLELACAMIRNGDSIVYLYASPLPRLFSPTLSDDDHTYNREKLKKFFGEDPPPPASSINWSVDKKPLALKLLSLCHASLENDMATPFQLCAIIAPKLVRNLDAMTFSDQDKLKLAMDILSITQETLEAGHDIEELVSHGLELLSTLLPSSSTPQELKEFMHRMIDHVVTSGQASLLFLIRNSCVYMKNAFPEDVENIQSLFHSLVFKGKRNEIRGLFKVCREPLNDDMYSPLRRHLYRYGNGQISGRQLQAITELIVAVMDLQKSHLHKRLERLDEEDNDDSMREKEEKRKREAEVVNCLVQPFIITADEALRDNRFKKDVWESVLSQLSRISLFRTLFSEELIDFYNCSVEELQMKFKSKFPPDILADRPTMEVLSLCATRIEHMQVPRYQSLKKVLSNILCHYLTIRDGNETELSLLKREELLLTHIANFPRNIEDRSKFIEKCGYSERFIRGDFRTTVKTDGSHSLEENMRQTLLTCYTEFVDILKQLGVTHVSVDGDMIKSTELFDELLTLTELKGRRAIAVRAIDQRLGGTREGHFHEKKLALLTREDDIESDYETQAKAPIKPKTFTVKLNIGFFDCARCCGSQIIGCYAPTGEHCERPLEIGIRSDSGFLSIYDENDREMENIEILLCEEGLYIFKAYTNGHPYDTSQVWVQTFTEMLQGPLPLVPAIMISKTFPNQRTWDLLLRSSVQTELTGSMITCQCDFSPEWRTYYDHRPEKVRCGVDVILHLGFTMSHSSNKPVFMRQISKVTKDLAGLIFDDTMGKLLEDDDLKQFRFLGKYLSQFISHMIEEGVARIEIINDGFDYEKWKRTQERQKRMIDSSIRSKDKIVKILAHFLEENIENWCIKADIVELCQSSHKQLLQLKAFLDNYSKKNHELQSKHRELNSILIRCIYVAPVSSLSRPTQEELIHWIFRNEDRVWRYRGGRDGHETLQQFMSFIGNSNQTVMPAVNKKRKLYSGVAVFIVPSSLSVEFKLDVDTDLGVSNLIGYSVGEMIVPSEDSVDRSAVGSTRSVSRWEPKKPDCYEVVTSWVNPCYRRLNLSVQMYFHVVQFAPSRLIVCDMLVGSVNKIITSNPLLRFLQWTRILNHVIWKRQQSYSVEMQTGRNEQFEQVVFLAWPMRLCLALFRVSNFVTSFVRRTATTLPNQVD